MAATLEAASTTTTTTPDDDATPGEDLLTFADVVDVVPPPFPAIVYEQSQPRSHGPFGKREAAAPSSTGGPSKRTYTNKVPFRSLYRYADRFDKTMMVIGCICGAAGGAMFPLMMLLMGDLVDSFNANSFFPTSGSFAIPTLSEMTSMAGTLMSMDDINRIVKWMLVLGAANFVLRFVVSLGCTISGSRQAKIIRRKYFEAALAQEMGWFDSRQTGGMTAALTDIQTIEDGIGERLPLALQIVAGLISSLVMGLVKGWKLALVILATSPLSMIGAGLLTAVMTRLVRNSTEFYNSAGEVATEIISSVRTVTAFGMQPAALKRYNNNLVTTRKMGTKKGWAMGGSFGLMFFFMFATFGLGFWYASTLIEDGGMTAGSALVVFMVTSMGTMMLGQLAPLMQSFAEASGAAYDIFRTIDRKSTIDPRDKTGDIVEIEGNVEFRGVTFRYPTRPEAIILHNFDLKIPVGKTVALVGPSGCGKSTVVGMLERFYDAEDGFGNVLIDGRPIKSINLRCLRQQIGLVSQEPVLFAKTIAENIAYGSMEKVTQEEIVEAAKQANAHDFISALPEGYQTLVGERGVQMSGGQKQRIAIARALIRKPKILIFDEATSALDTESEKIVQAAIDKVARGRTCVIIAHRLSTVRDADIIATFDQGKVCELGTHDELMAMNGLYRRLVERQQIEGGKAKRRDRHRHHQHHQHHQKQHAEEVSPDVSPSVSPAPGGSAKSPSPEIDLVEAEHEAELKKINRAKYKMLRRAFGILRPYTHITLLGCISSLLDGAIFPVFGLLMAEMIGVLMWMPMFPGAVSEDQHHYEVKMWSIGFLLLGVAAFVIQLFKAVGREIASERMAHHLRFESFKSMLRQEIGWFDDRHNMTGVLATRLATDATLLHSLTGNQLAIILQIVGALGTGIVIAFTANWKIALVVTACLPVVIACSITHMSYMIKHAQNMKKAYEQSGKVANEALENVRTVVSLTRENSFIDAFALELRKPDRVGLRSTIVHATGSSVMALTQGWIAALTFWYGGTLATQEAISFSTIMRANYGIMMASNSIGQAATFFPDYGKSISAAFHIFTLFDRKPAIPAPSCIAKTAKPGVLPPDDYPICGLHEDAPKKQLDKRSLLPATSPSPSGGEYPSATIEDFRGQIEFRDVQFSYPTRPGITVLNGMSFGAQPQQTVALVGESGCGKSTVISLLERFYDPTGGAILLDGRPAADLDIEWMRGQIGLVSQEPVLFATSIEENIRYGKPGATHDEIVEAAKQANAHGFISSFPDGYNTTVGEKGVTLSGGQKQRIAIARALIRNPKILLLDEATSALDAESEKVVQEALDRARMGRTTIVIAHRLSTIRDADRILVVSGGKVAEAGTHAELMAMGSLYANLASAQV